MGKKLEGEGRWGIGDGGQNRQKEAGEDREVAQDNVWHGFIRQTRGKGQRDNIDERG